MCSPEERHLLDKLASGALDGRVGDEREYHHYYRILCGKFIRGGVPVAYRQGVESRNVPAPSERTEETFVTDDQKLRFLQRFGWLMEDDDVRAYSSRFKPGCRTDSNSENLQQK